ncbi:MAG: ABC transporter permease, partial [Myxococcota bacterium]
ALTTLSLATSFALLMSVDRLRSGARRSFESTMAGTDLLVGAQGSSIQLLLYAVFRLGEPVPELSWESYEKVSAHPEVAWTIPISLGDSVQGFRVLGTTQAYFEHYQYGSKASLQLRSGRRFQAHFDAVLGSRVARELGWSIGDKFPIQHGTDKTAKAHAHAAFEVVGVLQSTGTPVDRTIHVPLQGLVLTHHTPHEAKRPVHSHEEDHEQGHHADGTEAGHRVNSAHEAVHSEEPKLGHHEHPAQAEFPETISAVLVGLRSKLGIFQMRAWINDFSGEAVMAVIPARAFRRLWTTVGAAERTLTVIGILVSFAGILALVATILATVSERHREMAILRSMGASPLDVAGLIVGEAVLIAFVSSVVALTAVYLGGWLGHAVFVQYFGLQVAWPALTASDVPWLLAFWSTAAVASLVPAVVSYRRTIADGLVVRL